MARPAKLAPAFTPARKTLASTSTSNVFQSFGLNSVGGAGGEIEGKTAGGAPRPAPPPPPPAAPASRPACPAGARARRRSRWLDSQHRASRPRQRLSTADAPLRVDGDGGR